MERQNKKLAKFGEFIIEPNKEGDIMIFCDTCKGYLDDPEYCADCTVIDDFETDYYYNDEDESYYYYDGKVDDDYYG